MTDGLPHHSDLAAADAARLVELGARAGMVIHEVNADLSVLLGRLQLAEMKLEGEHPATDDLRLAREIAQSLCQAVRGLWTHERAANLVSIRSIVERVIESMGSSGVLLAPGPDVSIRCETWRIERVISNLLRNALAASETARVEICSTWNVVGGATITVRNTPRFGPSRSIDPRPISRTGVGANPKSGAEPGPSTVPKGWGLLLCRSVLSAIGGQLDVAQNADGEVVASAFFPDASAENS